MNVKPRGVWGSNPPFISMVAHVYGTKRMRKFDSWRDSRLYALHVLWCYENWGRYLQLPKCTKMQRFQCSVTFQNNISESSASNPHTVKMGWVGLREKKSFHTAMNTVLRRCSISVILENAEWIRHCPHPTQPTLSLNTVASSPCTVPLRYVRQTKRLTLSLYVHFVAIYF